MRGTDHQTCQLFSYLSRETMVPQDQPLRVIRRLANAALDRLSPAFSQLYLAIGRPSIPPEQLLRALLLQAFFTLVSTAAMARPSPRSARVWAATYARNSLVRSPIVVSCVRVSVTRKRPVFARRHPHADRVHATNAIANARPSKARRPATLREELRRPVPHWRECVPVAGYAQAPRPPPRRRGCPSPASTNLAGSYRSRPG
jgi:hypothetical protein